MSDLHEFFSVSGSRVDRQHIPNARGIEFVFEEVGFQGRSLFRFQAVVKCASRYRDGRVKTECFREILGIVQREFLTVKVADGGMGLHDNSRFVSVDTSHERALNGGDQAILKFVGVFAEVPHVAICVLSEPIERILGQLAVRGDRIVDFDTPDPEDHPGMVCHGELIVFKTLGRLTLVNEGRARRQWEIRIIDARDKVRRIDHRVVRSFAQTLARCQSRVVLVVADLPHVISICRRLVSAILPCGRIRKVIAFRPRDPIITLRCPSTGRQGGLRSVPTETNPFRLRPTVD